MKTLCCFLIFLVHNCTTDPLILEDVDTDTDTDIDAFDNVESGDTFSFNEDNKVEDSVSDEEKSLKEKEYPNPKEGFGFKPKLREIDGTKYIVRGDTLEDFCLPSINKELEFEEQDIDFNDEDTKVCMHDYFFNSGKDYLILDFSFFYCPPCNLLADNERALISFLAKNDYRVDYVTVLSDQRENAVKWHEKHSGVGHVLYDYPSIITSKWTGDTWPETLRSFPTLVYIRLSDMKVLVEHLGFPMVVDEEFFHLQLDRLDYVIDNQ